MDLNRGFKMEEKFYKIGHGWASKYLWFDWKLEVKKGTKKFEENIKKGEAIFDRYSGVTPADIANSTSATILYSENLINLLEKNGVKLKKWSVKIILSEKNKKKVKFPLPRYYYIEPKSFVECITDDTILKKEERETLQKKLDNWDSKNNSIYFKGSDLMKTFYNISTWDGSDLFGGKDTGFIIVTERLKKIIEKAKLKNIEFEELKKYE